MYVDLHSSETGTLFYLWNIEYSSIFPQAAWVFPYRNITSHHVWNWHCRLWGSSHTFLTRSTYLCSHLIFTQFIHFHLILSSMICFSWFIVLLIANKQTNKKTDESFIFTCSSPEAFPHVIRWFTFFRSAFHVRFFIFTFPPGLSRFHLQVIPRTIHLFSYVIFLMIHLLSCDNFMIHFYDAVFPHLINFSHVNFSWFIYFHESITFMRFFFTGLRFFYFQVCF